MTENVGIFSLSGTDDFGYNVYKSENNKVLFRHKLNYWLVSIFHHVISMHDLTKLHSMLIFCQM